MDGEAVLAVWQALLYHFTTSRVAWTASGRRIKRGSALLAT